MDDNQNVLREEMSKTRDNSDSKDLKKRLKILNSKYSLVEIKLDKKMLESSKIVEDLNKVERELGDCKLLTRRVNERWKMADIEINKLKWMKERGLIVLESNARRNELHGKSVKTIEEKHLELTTRAFKTVRQEVVGSMINAEINNLYDSKKELEYKLFRLRKSKAENENYLTEASMELIEIKTRAATVDRLREKLKESENLRSNAVKKLRDLKRKKNTSNGDSID